MVKAAPPAAVDPLPWQDALLLMGCAAGLRKVMSSLTRHLHAFVREVRLT